MALWSVLLSYHPSKVYMIIRYETPCSDCLHYTLRGRSYYIRKNIFLICLQCRHFWKFSAKGFDEMRKTYCNATYIIHMYVQSVRSRHQYLLTFFLKRVVNIVVLKLKPVSNQSQGNCTYYRHQHVSILRTYHQLGSK